MPQHYITEGDISSLEHESIIASSVSDHLVKRLIIRNLIHNSKLISNFIVVTGAKERKVQCTTANLDDAIDCYNKLLPNQ